MARSRAAEEIEDEIPPLHPKLSEHLIAHAAAEKQLLSMITANRLPHALLFTGPRGIGKATLAYRLARFLLAPPASGDSLFGETLAPESLHIPSTHPTFRRVAAGSHADLLVLESDKIDVEEARQVAGFLALTPAEGAWRVVIIDSADAMNRNAANALLKTLEEPPSQAIILLVSHNPGTLLPTIRSRCHRLRLSPPTEVDFARIMGAIAPSLPVQEYPTWSLLAGGSPGVALSLMEVKADGIYREMLERLNAPDTFKLYAFADLIARKDNGAEWQVFARLLLWLLERICETGAAHTVEVFPGERQMLARLAGAKPLEFWTELWEKAGRLLSDADHLHLDRKQAVLTLLRAAE